MEQNIIWSLHILQAYNTFILCLCLHRFCISSIQPKITQETRVQYLGQEDPLEREWQPTPVFLPGEFHRQEPGGLQSME